MPAVQIMVTQAGLDALVDAQNGVTEAIVISEIGLANAAFAAAPTLTALPHEFKRIAGVSGQAASATVIHLTAQDTSTQVYTVYGFGLFLADGTLFAVYSSADPIVAKVSIAAFLIAVDIAFLNAVAADIEFGNTNFLYPPATEDTQGVARIATNAQADAGTNDATIMSPKKVKRRTDALQAAVNAQLATFTGVIVMWSGALAAIPDGWALCDGANGTPDLRDQFIIGAGGTHAPGATGGALTHNHGGATGDHALTEAQLPAHDHELFANATSAADITGGGAHAAWSTGSAAGNQDYDIAGTATAPTLGASSSVGGGAPHNHPIDAANHLPPFYALAFIIKL